MPQVSDVPNELCGSRGLALRLDMDPTGEGAEALSGRHALVTGVSRREGIGFAVARHLATLGARVTIQGFAPHDCEYLGVPGDGAVTAVVDALRAVDPGIVFIDADFLDPDAAGRVVAEAVAARGPLDILVANHARSSSGTLDEGHRRRVDRSFAIDARGSILLAQAFAAPARRRAGGRIVMMTSGQHGSAMPTNWPRGVEGRDPQATRTLAAHLMRADHRQHGQSRPDGHGWADAETQAVVEDLMPTGSLGSPADAARLIGLLCSDDAAWVTGQVIDADGGFSL